MNHYVFMTMKDFHVLSAAYVFSYTFSEISVMNLRGQIVLVIE